MKFLFILLYVTGFSLSASAYYHNFTNCLMKTELEGDGMSLDGKDMIDSILQFSSTLEFGCPTMAKIRGSEGIVLNLQGANGHGTSCEYSYVDLSLKGTEVLAGNRMKIYCESNTQPIGDEGAGPLTGDKPE